MNLDLRALQLVEQALSVSKEELDGFLVRECEGNEELLKHVKDILANNEDADNLLRTSTNRDDSTASMGSAARHVRTHGGKQQFLIGTVLADRYRIEASIGVGGMGEVYRATDTLLNRDVAIKVLNLASIDNEELRQRFEREIQSVASLSHPNIVALHDFVADGETEFAVMEFVDGMTLRERITDGIDMPHAVSLTLGIASALHAAHSQGIMHRDIKPENVMVSEDGHVKVLDFGLARPVEAMQDQGLTATSLIPGTLPYMSPEQAEAIELTQATDVFSLGTVFYEMLTGTNPFRGATAIKTIRLVCDANPPPVEQQARDLPTEIVSLVRTMLDRQAAARPGSREVIDRLNDVQQALSQLSHQPPTLEKPEVPTNLPLRRIELTGRDDEIATLIDRLQRSPIVTVVGAGGVGKTSIALEIARGSIDKFLGGVWFCEFAPVRNEEDVTEVLASVLDGSAGSVNGVDEIASRLRGAPTLLLFDNCEHVIDAVADLCEDLSQRIPELTILATSREALNVAGEYVSFLSGLECDGPQSDAANLFARRAEELVGYEDEHDKRHLIESIVQRLEGWPLAIELAVPRLSLMSLEELLEALDDQLSTLRGRRRSRDRQAALDSAIAWSFDLLEPDEQAMLLDLSVFTSSFVSDAAMAVSDSKAGAGKLRLQRLVEQSVVVRTEREGESRFRLLEPIRQFCHARIDDDSLAEARKRHGYHFAARAAELGKGIYGHNELMAAQALNIEWPDLREAIAWGREQKVSEVAIDPIIYMARMVMFHLRVEAYLWLIAAEREFGEAASSRADVNYVLANGYWIMGNLDAAAMHWKTSEAIAPTPQCHWVGFLMNFAQNRFADAACSAGEGAELAKQLGNDGEWWWLMAFQLVGLGFANPDDSLIDENIAVMLDHISGRDWPSAKAWSLMGQGAVAIARRELPEAFQFLTSAAKAAVACGNRWIETIAGLMANGVSDPSIPSQERLATAVQLLRMLIDMGEEAHYPLAVRSLISSLVECDYVRLAAKCSAIVPFVKGVGDESQLSPQYPETVERMKSSLGDDAYAELVQHGRNLSVEDVALLASEVLK